MHQDLYIVLAGITGTALMTLYIFIFSGIRNNRIQVVFILGTMLLNFTDTKKTFANRTLPLVIGSAAHYSAGIILSLFTGLVWNEGFLLPTVWQSLLLGAFEGAFAVIIWMIFFYIHPHPPKIPKHYFFFWIFTGHFFFSMGQLYTFLFLNT